VVPQFGRDLYYVDLPRVIPRPGDAANADEKSKYDVLGARWPSRQRRGDMRRARDNFVRDLSGQVFRAIIFDYDGTLCGSQRNDAPPPGAIVEHIKSLVTAKVVVGIASGRGGSVQECLAAQLPHEYLSAIQLGLYNGGWIENALAAPGPTPATM